MKKELKRYPTFFSNMSKEKINKILHDDGDNAMVDKKKKVSRKSLTKKDVARMIEEWDDKTIKELGTEFDVSYQTILLMAKEIHKEDGSLCPPKPKKARRRIDTAKAGIALFKEKENKE